MKLSMLLFLINVLSGYIFLSIVCWIMKLETRTSRKENLIGHGCATVYVISKLIDMTIYRADWEINTSFTLYKTEKKEHSQVYAVFSKLFC